MEFPRDEWRVEAPSVLGFDSSRLAEAVQFAVDSELDWPTDISQLVARADPPPFNKPFGPTKPRGSAAGMVVREGVVAATWGDPDRVDVTFSATKSYLSTCVGLAFDKGLIEDLDAPVCSTVTCDEFAGEHNRQITWRHLLQQTSEWSGTLFDIPDSVDHNRSVMQGDVADSPKKGEARQLRTPGSYWEYNDVRVNALGFAALHVFREPLVDVLHREIMDRIGATHTWEWHPYDNAYVEIDGQFMPSVPGGAHWGGGIWISASDHARFGHLWLNRGQWGDRRLLSEAWIEAALTPCPVNPRYGFMWWLNADQQAWPKASSGAFAAQGAGGNVVCVIPEHALVVVTRWAQDPGAVIDRVIQSLNG